MRWKTVPRSSKTFLSLLTYGGTYYQLMNSTDPQGNVTQRTLDSLERVTKIARKMVTEYGMSDKLGPRTFGKREELVFLGREIHEQRNYSEKVALQIDDEVNLLIQHANVTALKIMENNKERLKIIAEQLIADETIDEDQFEELMKRPLLSAALEASPTS